MLFMKITGWICFFWDSWTLILFVGLLDLRENLTGSSSLSKYKENGPALRKVLKDSSIHPFLHISIFSFIHLSIHSFIDLFIHPFIHSLVIKGKYREKSGKNTKNYIFKRTEERRNGKLYFILEKYWKRVTQIRDSGLHLMKVKIRIPDPYFSVQYIFRSYICTIICREIWLEKEWFEI